MGLGRVVRAGGECLGLSEPEIVELLAGGPAPGQPSAFASASDFLRATSLLAIERAGWNALDAWRHERSAGEVRYARHMAHAERPAGEWPAYVDLDACPLCSPVA